MSTIFEVSDGTKVFPLTVKYEGLDNPVLADILQRILEAGQPKEIDFENYTDLAIQSVTVPNYENRGCFEVDMPEDGIPILTVHQVASSSTDYMDWMNIYINGAIFQTFHTVRNTYTYCPLPWMKQGTHIRAICRHPTAVMKAFYKKYK